MAQETHWDGKTVQELAKQYLREQLRRVGRPSPKGMGSDEVSVAKGHTYRLVVRGLVRRPPIWFGGQDCSAASRDRFSAWMGPPQSHQLRWAVTHLWQPWRTSTRKVQQAPPASIRCDKFPVLSQLGDALDAVRKSEYARLAGRVRRFIKGQKDTLLARREHYTYQGRQALKLWHQANRRGPTAAHRNRSSPP